MTILKNFSTLLLLLSFLIAGCKSKKVKNKFSDTPESGTISISIDESFRPVMEEQIRMYELAYPNAHINAVYKSEADCFRDFFKDSNNRMVIVGRGLTAKEEHFMIDSLGYNPGCQAVASDAVAVIVNSKSTDTIFTMSSLSESLQGKNTGNKTFVFDGLNATSTVRFIRDSILKGKMYDTSVVKAAKSSQEVVEYVANHDNAVGFVGISWIGNPEDSAQLKLLQSVKLSYVRCDVCEGTPYVRPMQESMMTRRYPLVRNLHYIIKENFSGLGTGFCSFLKFERGQLIFKRSYLGPVMDFSTRNIQINETLQKK
jgi:phosphate transport system substrate-binding protein